MLKLFRTDVQYLWNSRIDGQNQNHCSGAVDCANTPALTIFVCSVCSWIRLQHNYLHPLWTHLTGVQYKAKYDYAPFVKTRGGPIASGRCKKRPIVSPSVPFWKISQRIVRIIYENSNNSKQLCPSHNNWTLAWGGFSIFAISAKVQNILWRRFLPNCAANIQLMWHWWVLSLPYVWRIRNNIAVCVWFTLFCLVEKE